MKMALIIHPKLKMEDKAKISFMDFLLNKKKEPVNNEKIRKIKVKVFF